MSQAVPPGLMDLTHHVINTRFEHSFRELNGII
jgi:hypothetical protein